MKYAVVVLLLCALSLNVRAAPNKEKFLAAVEKCKTETGATDEDIANLMTHEPAKSKEGACVNACVMKSLDLMDENGKIKREGALKVVKHMATGDADKEKRGTEIVDACIGIEVPADHCDAAETYLACVKKEAIARGFNLKEKM